MDNGTLYLFMVFLLISLFYGFILAWSASVKSQIGIIPQVVKPLNQMGKIALICITCF